MWYLHRYVIICSMSEVEFVPAYAYDQEVADWMYPALPTLQSALGTSAVFDHGFHAWDVYTTDYVETPPIPEPRNNRNASTSAAGFVDPSLLNSESHADLFGWISEYFQPHLDEAFYQRHDLPVGLPLHVILKDAYAQDADGNFIMPTEAYIALLSDLHTYHQKETTAFNERLQGHTQSYAEQLKAGELEHLVSRFQDHLANTRIILDDGFETILKFGAGRYEASSYGSNKLLCAPVQDAEQRILYHEFSHMLEGTEMTNTLQSYPLLNQALREAFASHMESYLLQGGDIESLHPSHPERQDSGYDTWRSLFNFLANGGKYSLSAREWIDFGTRDSDEVNQEFLNKIQSCFPKHPNILTQLEQKMSECIGSDDANDIYTISPEQEQTLLDFLSNMQTLYDRRVKLPFLRKILGKITPS